MTTQTPTKPAASVTPPKQPAAQNTPAKLNAGNVAGFLFSDPIKKQIALALPQHLKAERMIRMALTTVRRTPKLLECDPMTLVAGIVQASELGLELSGPLGQAYLIPRKNRGQMEATFQIGYRGFIKLAANTGQVAFFNARAVRAGDFFQYELGTSQFVKHRSEAPRGAKITHFYGVLRLKDGSADCEVWSLSDMEEHRDRYRSDKFLKDKDKNYLGPWDTDFEAMGCKTMIRELAKRAPLSAELMSQAARDEYSEYGLDPMLSAAEIMPAVGERNGTPAEEGARPETLEEIEIQMRRAGVTGKAADELTAQYTQGGELTEAAAQELLRELAGMPDLGD